MTILLFDLDGTLVLSGRSLETPMIQTLESLASKYQLGIVGGGAYEKIRLQLGEALSLFRYIFSECGCVIHDCHGTLLARHQLSSHPLYPEVGILIKKALAFLATVDYPLTGHFIDRRSGIIYISLIGMSATEEERHMFLSLNEQHHYISRLLTILQKDCPIGLDVVRGGSVGIAIYPTEWDKIQVLDFLSSHDDDSKNHEIHFFGDKYTLGGNDYRLITHPSVHGHPTDHPSMTLSLLSTF